MAVARHGTLTGSSTVDTVTITSIDPSVTWLTVLNTAATGDLYFTVATNGTTAATPTVAGNDTYRCCAGRPERPVEIGRATSLSIKMISTAALTYTIEAE